MQEGDIEIWLDDDQPDSDLALQTAAGENNHYPHNNLIKAYLIFLFTWQSIFRLSDVGMGVILSFVAVFLLFLGKTFAFEPLLKFVSYLPRTVYASRKILNRNKDSFTKYVCCPKCSSLYKMDECIVTSRGNSTSKISSHVRFPRHPWISRRSACGTTLMKSVRTSAGNTFLYPQQLYCYKSIIDSLKEKLALPNFISDCEKWCWQESKPGVLEDVFDGKVWKDFLNPGGIPFLSLPYNYAFILNVDWFQPFQHSQYACGAVYVAVLNLPRSVRYSINNVILLGIIPGPKEPELTINTFIEPLVNELLQLWDGLVIQTCNGAVLVRGALLCVACDIPAARKVCGFSGHNSRRACSKCLKLFPTENFGEQPDFSGYDRDNWKERCLADHKEHCTKHREAQTRAAQKKIEQEYGCRYSALLSLPYFDPITMCIVDPMHNLSLGTTKHMLSLWKSMKLIKEDDFHSIQEKVDSFLTPPDVGRIPSKIASGFSGFKAEQFRNWVLIFSNYSLKSILPHSHFDCWHLFVKACHLLCRRTITEKQALDADNFLMEFCRTFESLYGKENCTINMHLHLHLSMCVRDFGPIYAFWLFAFERLNGVLGAFHMNSRDITLQLMRRFLRISENGIENWPKEYRNDLSPLIEKCIYSKGSLKHISFEEALADEKNIKPVPPMYEAGLTTEEKSSLVVLHQSETEQYIEVFTVFCKCRALKVGEFLLCSTRYSHASLAMACTNPTSELTLVKILYFAQVSSMKEFENRKTTVTTWFAKVQTFEHHNCRVWFGLPTEVWTRVEANECFIPLSYLKYRVAHVSDRVDFGRIIGTDSVFVVVPL